MREQLDFVKCVNFSIIVIGASLIGYFFQSWCVGIGIALIAFGLMPTD